MSAENDEARVAAIEKDSRTLVFLSDGSSGSDKVKRPLEAIPWLLDRLRDAEARAAEAEAVAVALMEATSVLGSTDAEMIQWIGTAFESTRSQEVLDRVKAEAWDAGARWAYEEITGEPENRFALAPGDNPYRKQVK